MKLRSGRVIGQEATTTTAAAKKLSIEIPNFKQPIKPSPFGPDGPRKNIEKELYKTYVVDTLKHYLKKIQACKTKVQKMVEINHLFEFINEEFDYITTNEFNSTPADKRMNKFLEAVHDKIHELINEQLAEFLPRNIDEENKKNKLKRTLSQVHKKIHRM